MKNSEIEVTELNDSSEQELCYSCLGVNLPGVHFCRHCQAPLTSYAAIGPLEKAYALGDFVRKGTKHRNTAIRWTVWILTWVLLIAIGFGMMLP